MIRQDLKDRVIAWDEARNFFGEGGATVEGQLAKLLEEASELVTAVVMKNDVKTLDAVGDCLVVLTILERMGCQIFWPERTYAYAPIFAAAIASMQVAEKLAAVPDLVTIYPKPFLDAARSLYIDPNTALEHALREIEPRTGSWVGGVFVKDAK